MHHCWHLRPAISLPRRMQAPQLQAQAAERADSVLRPRLRCGGRLETPCSRRTALACRAALWGRQPDEWDMQWEQEENARRQQTQQVTLSQQAAQEAAWRQQVDVVHQQLLDQQKHKAALRQRLKQDAQRAKREQLRRIEPVAKARARANGLASLGLDPEIMALSEKFGRLSGLVDEVQQRVEAQYGLMGSLDEAAAYGQLAGPAPAASAAAYGQQLPLPVEGLGQRAQLQAGPGQQSLPPTQLGQQQWPQQQPRQPRPQLQQLPSQQRSPAQQPPQVQRPQVQQPPTQQREQPMPGAPAAVQRAAPRRYPQRVPTQSQGAPDTQRLWQQQQQPQQQQRPQPQQPQLQPQLQQQQDAHPMQQQQWQPATQQQPQRPWQQPAAQQAPVGPSQRSA